MAEILRSNLLNNATVTANGNSTVITNDGRTSWVLLVRVANAPTGTSPTLTFSVQVSVDGVNFVQAGTASLASITAAGSQRTVYAVNSTQGPIVEPFIQVFWTVGGTTPSFTGVYADLVGIGMFD